MQDTRDIMNTVREMGLGLSGMPANASDPQGAGAPWGQQRQAHPPMGSGGVPADLSPRGVLSRLSGKCVRPVLRAGAPGSGMTPPAQTPQGSPGSRCLLPRDLAQMPGADVLQWLHDGGGHASLPADPVDPDAPPTAAHLPALADAARGTGTAAATRAEWKLQKTLVD